MHLFPEFWCTRRPQAGVRLTLGLQQVVPHGVFVEGVSASMTTSDRIVLQLKERSREIKLPEVTGMSKNEASNPKWTTLPEDEERSRVELNGSGVEVRLILLAIHQTTRSHPLRNPVQ